MSDFAGKIVLITGAGRGLGKDLAIAFASKGARVAANDVTPINMDEVVAEIAKEGGRAKSYVAEISKKLSLQTLITQVLEDWERIDVLVNHISVQPRDPLLDMDEWDWRAALDANLTGPFLAMQTVGRVMRELGGGVMLNVGAPGEDSAAYVAAKAGLMALTRAAAEEFAPYNIRVNGVAVSGAAGTKVVEEALALCGDEGKTGEVLDLMEA